MNARIIDAARAACEAYESRFGSIYPETRHNFTGPIDDEMVALRVALDGGTPVRYVAKGKGDDHAYSVRTIDGAPVCTCAYNGGYIEDRIDMAQQIANALNAYQP